MDVVVQRFDIVMVRIATLRDHLTNYAILNPFTTKKEREAKAGSKPTHTVIPSEYLSALQAQSLLTVYNSVNQPAKKQLCLVVSPDELNRQLHSVIVAPMTTKSKPYPTRVPCHYDDKDGYILLDQIRAVHKRYLEEKVGHISEEEASQVLAVLGEMFAE